MYTQHSMRIVVGRLIIMKMYSDFPLNTIWDSTYGCKTKNPFHGGTLDSETVKGLLKNVLIMSNKN